MEETSQQSFGHFIAPKSYLWSTVRVLTMENVVIEK